MLLTDIIHIIDGVFHYKLFEVNRTPITLSSIVIFSLILLVSVLVSRGLQRTVLQRILNRTHIDRGTRFTLLRLSHYIIVVIGAILAFQFVGIDLSGLAVIFGLLSVGIGFGLQNVTSNFVAGLILLFERPISVGDRVTIGGTVGDVVAINMRATTIRSLNNISIIVPNSEFVSSRVVNWSHGDPTVRLDLPVGVSYNSDLDSVVRALKEVADENGKILKEPQAEVFFANFGDSSWNLELRVWLSDLAHYYQIQSEINSAIVRKFRENSIEIPYPQRDLHVREPLPLAVQTGEGRQKTFDTTMTDPPEMAQSDIDRPPFMSR
jgi:small-conductance mechanosensitive channel